MGVKTAFHFHCVFKFARYFMSFHFASPSRYSMSSTVFVSSIKSNREEP